MYDQKLEVFVEFQTKRAASMFIWNAPNPGGAQGPPGIGQARGRGAESNRSQAFDRYLVSKLLYKNRMRFYYYNDRDLQKNIRYLTPQAYLELYSRPNFPTKPSAPPRASPPNQMGGVPPRGGGIK